MNHATLPVPSGRRGRRRARFAGVAMGAALAVGVAGCGFGSSSPSARVLPDPTSQPSVSTPATGSSGTPSLPGEASSGPSASGAAAASGDAGGTVLVDPSLLSRIPVSGHGLVQTVDPDTTAQVAEDPSLRANASGLIIAAYILDPASSSAAPTDDIAVVSVIRLRDPKADDNWFRDWRDSYDTAACANAGGVTRRAQTDIGTHTVFIGSCAGGSFTYHTRIENGAIVISVTSVGDARIGETIMERLAP